MSVAYRFALLLLATIALEAAEPARTYRISMCPWIAWSPTHVAEATGIWKRLGVEVVVINQLGEEEHFAAVEKKAVDLSIDMIGAYLGMHQRGCDVVVLGELDWSHGGDKVLAHNRNQPIHPGDSVGIYHDDPAVLMLLDRVLAQYQLKLSDVTIAQYDPAELTAHFITGRLPVVLSYDPYAMEVEKAGGQLLATSANFPGCIPEGLGGRRDVVATIPRADLEKIIAGWIEAQAWCRDPANWKEYVRILNERTFARDKAYPEEELKQMLGNVRIHDPATLAERNALGGGLLRWVEDAHRMMAANHLIKREFSPNAMIDTSALLNVLQRLTPAVGK